MNNEERYKKLLGDILAYTSEWRGVMADKITAMISAALNPPPQTEEIKITQFALVWGAGNVLSCHDSEKEAQECLKAMGEDVFIVPISGPYQRPIKPKVQRREYVGYAEHSLTITKEHYCRQLLGMPPNAKIYAEWETE